MWTTENLKILGKKPQHLTTERKVSVKFWYFASIAVFSDYFNLIGIVWEVKFFYSIKILMEGLHLLN